MLVLNKIFRSIKNQPLTAIFVLIVFASFFWHENFRTKHFQECDSAGVYNMIYDFPKSTLSYTALSYPEGRLISKNLAEKILDNSLVKNQVGKYFAKYPKEQVIDRISKLNIFAVTRYAYIQGVIAMHLPHQLLGFFALPLGSTYSAGPGLVYSLITGSHTSYESFMSRVLFVDILIFHLAILLLYFTGRNLGLSSLSAIIPSLLMLFSISLYSSSYHTGSTLWNIFSGIVFLYIAAKYANDSKLLKKISLASAILVFFNYLIVFFWLAFLLANLSKKPQGQKFSIKALVKEFWQLLKTQKLAMLFFGVCGVLFFQPGQSARGGTSLSTLPGDFYYIVLNFFSFFNHAQWIIILEFILGLIIIFVVLKTLFAKHQFLEHQQIFKKTLAWILIIFCGLLLIKILSFVPTRHILFLSPVWFFALMLLLNKYTNKIKLLTSASIIITIAILGFVGLYQRKIYATDLTSNLQLPNDVQSAGVFDCSFNLVDKNWNSPVPVEFINPKNFEPGKNYLYISQVAPFSSALSQWRGKYDLEVKIISENNVYNPTYFVAFNPNLQRFLYSRPNSLYETKFQVMNISPK